MTENKLDGNGEFYPNVSFAKNCKINGGWLRVSLTPEEASKVMELIGMSSRAEMAKCLIDAHELAKTPSQRVAVAAALLQARAIKPYIWLQNALDNKIKFLRECSPEVASQVVAEQSAISSSEDYNDGYEDAEPRICYWCSCYYWYNKEEDHGWKNIFCSRPCFDQAELDAYKEAKASEN